MKKTSLDELERMVWHRAQQFLDKRDHKSWASFCNSIRSIMKRCRHHERQKK